MHGATLQHHGRAGGKCASTGGISFDQLRGDDFAIITSPEITPLKGLDLKPMYSYFYASGTTNGAARSGRGGINTTTAFTAPNGNWRAGINENRQTVGLDSRLRMGPFSLDSTLMYQFGNRDVVVPGVCRGSVYDDQRPELLGLRLRQDAWIGCQGRHFRRGSSTSRAGFQIGPLLLEAMYMFTSGNKAQDTTLNNVHYFQPLSTDTGYLADWGTQISSLGLDYFNGNAAGASYPGVTIGWDKYGRQQVSAKATYFLTPNLSMMGGAAVLLTASEDRHRRPHAESAPVVSRVVVSSRRLRPAEQAGDTNYMGTELFGDVTWRFAPGSVLGQRRRLHVLRLGP